MARQRMLSFRPSVGNGRNFKVAGRLTGPLIAAARVPKIIWSLPNMEWRIRRGLHRPDICAAYTRARRRGDHSTRGA
ncbi:putative AlkP superfamily phosphohydrolase/phosphomutase [Paraburkholderia caledonica]|uniref:AlkP superfamily phosphohydrolase/phosphomutase n=1 Tax=Paraburkholderia caledonica TaxID=134536 RepID=A0AB73IM69_9BURK|nr:putative AlkP superfamily phosphohydrolase/phosphomutase [Paraburkholderia caledonica]